MEGTRDAPLNQECDIAQTRSCALEYDPHALIRIIVEAIDLGGDSYMSTLAEDPLPICPLCGKPCSLEDCVTNAEGRAVHKDCYRDALISQQGSL